MTIGDAARDRSSVIPVPEVFEIYQGFNDVKRKKVKQMPLDVRGLQSHSEALYRCAKYTCACEHSLKYKISGGFS